MPQSYLNIGNLDTSSSANFIEHILVEKDAKVFALIKPSPEGAKLLLTLCPYLDKKLFIFYGSTSNRLLLQNIIQKNEVMAVFYHLKTPPPEPKSIVSTAREQLFEVTSLLEGLRTLPSNAPTLVPICHSQNIGDFLMADGNGGYSAIVKSKTFKSAQFSSAYALFHAFAVSYRLNIQVANLIGESCMSNEAFEFLYGLAEKTKDGNAKISVHHSTCQSAGDKHTKNEKKKIAKILVFGDSECKKLNEKLKELTDSVDESIKVLQANSQPGKDTDEVVINEIVAKSPSHIVFLPEQSGEALRAYEQGGPSNLLDNVRENLFKPWLLADVCKRFGINFVNMDKVHSNGVHKTDEAIPTSRCDVVKKFANKLLALRE